MILLLSDDLMDASKTMAQGRAHGVDVVQCKSYVEAVIRMELNEISCCIVDLHLPGLEINQLLFAYSDMKRSHESLPTGRMSMPLDSARRGKQAAARLCRGASILRRCRRGLRSGGRSDRRRLR